MKPRTTTTILLAATAFGLFEGLKGFVASRLRGQPLGWVDLLIQNMPWWYGWALLAPLVLWMGRRFPLIGDSRHRVHYAALHLVVATVAAAAHLALVGTIFFHSVRIQLPFSSPFALVIQWQANFLVVNMLTYGVILGAGYAVEYNRRYRESRIESARLAMEAAQAQQRMAEARLQALRMELNPHFLFNTLNAVSGLVRRGENDRAVTTLAHLGDLLRATLDRTAAPVVPLGEELAILQHYVDLEQVRLGDRLEVRIDVPEELDGALVPSLALQPLVENAIRHGIAPRAGPGRVTLVGWREGDRLTLEVRDTGRGLSPGRNGHGPSGVGLTNTRARLEHLYGSAAGLSLEAGHGGGAVARLWLPYRTVTMSENG
ncbi:MAG TPA: sensor histidine kinase [Gemmatimonadaceae bacterium]|nr:sensor histidine kinase [Gemmatimonadaceae bacterium]